MPTTLSKGYILPATGERGTWWANLLANWTRVNSHDHDDVNSAKIQTKNLTHGESDILAANWAAVAGQAGTYSQTVTVPSGYTMKTVTIGFFVDGGAEDGYQIHPTVRRASDTTYEVFINDNTLDLLAVYA